MRKEFKRLVGASQLENDFMRFAHEKGWTWVSFHGHACRENTFQARYFAHANIDPANACRLTLPQKQNLVRILHAGPAYYEEELFSRMCQSLLDQHLIYGTCKIVTLIDVTSDIGLRAINTAIKVRRHLKEIAPKLQLVLGIQPIFGFDNPEDWIIFEEAAYLPEVQVLGGLPEKSKSVEGFLHHMRCVINLSRQLNKPAHIHLDQMNLPNENGTELLIKLLDEEMGCLSMPDGSPLIYVIHELSPAGYGELRFFELMKGHKRNNLAVACCPRASVTTLHIRSVQAPLHPCITRVLDMILFGLYVPFGTDNIYDIFVPSGDGSMAKEMIILMEQLRYSNMEVLVKLGCGIKLERAEKREIYEFLREQNLRYRKESGQHDFPFIHDMYEIEF